MTETLVHWMFRKSIPADVLTSTGAGTASPTSPLASVTVIGFNGAITGTGAPIVPAEFLLNGGRCL